ncbi:MAG: FRG domain-containing protein [Saccharofermentanales bacterium]
MIQSIEVNSLSDAIDLFFEDSYDLKIGRYRSNYVFRGMHNVSYSLEPSFVRNCREQWQLEQNILRNFSKYAEMESPSMVKSVWRQMVLGQHYGLPTRLLDWTFSPLVALHFATEHSVLKHLDEVDGVVWQVHVDDVHEQLPKSYKDKLKEEWAYVFTVDMLDDITSNLEQYDKDMEGSSFVFLEPPSIDGRIINQYSLFSVVPSYPFPLDKYLSDSDIRATRYVIDKDIKWEIRDKLDQSNITERILFPGLQGLATWLKRHYYVRES